MDIYPMKNHETWGLSRPKKSWNPRASFSCARAQNVATERSVGKNAMAALDVGFLCNYPSFLREIIMATIHN